MEAFTKLTSTAIGYAQANVDTDRVIPARFLHLDENFGTALFYDVRHQADDTLDPNVVFNQERAKTARILVADVNFGCGSSREHAVWALTDKSSDVRFKCIIAASFGDIFYGNACKNGLLPVQLPVEEVQKLRAAVDADPNLEISVDLEANTVVAPGVGEWTFELDPFRRHCLLNGLDDIAFSLQFENEISAYEARCARETPWLSETRA